VEGCGSVFGFVVVESVRFLFVAVVGTQVEIHDDLHLLGKHIKRVLPEKRVPDGFDGVEVEFRSEVIEDVCTGWAIFTPITERGNRGPVGGCADEDLVDVFGIDISVLGETHTKCASGALTRKLRS